MTGKENNVAVITLLVETVPFGRPGRTAIVKLLYFLQTLRQVDLGYHFTLYSYGPFDAEVLADIEFATSLKAVTSNLVTFPSGYGYELQAGENAEAVKAQAASFLSGHKEDIQWVVSKFGRLSAADLELSSTAIFVDREASASGTKMTMMQLVDQVRDLKPRFDKARISSQVLFLADQLVATEMH